MFLKTRRILTAAITIIIGFSLTVPSGCKLAKDEESSRTSSPDEAQFRKMQTDYYLNSDGNAALTGLESDKGQSTLEIPETIDGHTVTKLDFSSQYFHYNIKEIIVPEALGFT